jgi:hypothetical protein
MSHFSVAVVTAHGTEAEVDRALAPYHEFECTARDDEYVVDVDQTADARAEYEKQTEDFIRTPEGDVAYYDDGPWWRPATPREMTLIEGVWEKRQADPDYALPFAVRSQDTGKLLERVWLVLDFGGLPGCEKVTKKRSELQSFAEFVEHWYGRKSVNAEADLDLQGEHKYGYCLVDCEGDVVKVVERTNPDAKWDWYQVGGRFNGYFDVEYDPDTDPENQEVCFICRGTGKRDDDLGRARREEDPTYTCNGCGGKGTKVSWPTQWKARGSSAQAKTIPFGPMARKRREDAAARWDSTKKSLDAAPEKFHAGWHGIDPREVSREDYVARRGRLPFSTFAVLDASGWHERGQMGWWGIVKDEQDEAAWDEQYEKFLVDLVENRPDAWVTIVDCHI